MRLQDLVLEQAQRRPEALAVAGAEDSATYGDLDTEAWRFARLFRDLGVEKGDRVGVWLEKSPRTVAAFQGALRVGAAYVPVDPVGPASRARTVLEDCAARVVVARQPWLDKLRELGYQPPAAVAIDTLDLDALPTAPLDLPTAGGDDLAYILYTSGSTGRPKGVCLSHDNARAFIDWAAATVEAEPADRFSSHAPFHFDLSVMDLYSAFHAGASVHLIPDGASYLPREVVRFLEQRDLTIWYSVPSILMLMMDEGGLLDLEPRSLRVVVFAGEPFPVGPLGRLRRHLPDVRLFNFYGPTETNVCTFHEVTEVDPDRPVPIGRAASGDRVWAETADGRIAGPGEEGELKVAGPTVMLGYWGQEPHGDGPYATGDLVRVLPDGAFDYRGRLDHMVKIRGHRVELGEVEAALERHPAVGQAVAVVAGSGLDKQLAAFVVPSDGVQPSLLELKRHCSQLVPRYMIVDRVCYVAELPRTRNGKVDRRLLVAQAESTSTLSRR